MVQVQQSVNYLGVLKLNSLQFSFSILEYLITTHNLTSFKQV